MSGGMCPHGEYLAAKHNDVAVSATGEPTALYYHLQTCDACMYMRLVGEPLGSGETYAGHKPN